MKRYDCLRNGLPEHEEDDSIVENRWDDGREDGPLRKSRKIVESKAACNQDVRWIGRDEDGGSCISSHELAEDPWFVV